MAKDAYYFTHDSNASQDPKIVQMLSVYGYQGYGWYWRLVEMLRDQEDHRLCMATPYFYHGMAMALLSKPDDIAKFIDDCVNQFHLFSREGDYFWSDSLNRRIVLYEQSKTRYAAAGKRGAQARWNSDAIENNGDAIKNDDIAKENHGIKVKESKVKESKDTPYPPSNPGDSGGVFDFIKSNLITDLTPAVEQEVNAAVEEHGAEKVLEAIKLAAGTERKKRTWRYVLGIIKNSRNGSKPHNQDEPNEDPDKYVKGRYGHLVRRGKTTGEPQAESP